VDQNNLNYYLGNKLLDQPALVALMSHPINAQLFSNFLNVNHKEVKSLITLFPLEDLMEYIMNSTT